MEELVLEVPGMWADHHVIAVLDLLLGEDGTTVTASARDATLRVGYDPARTDPDRIAAALTAGGYPPGERGSAATAPTDKPAWATAGVRTTATDPADLTMSGDHRKY